ncbi:MAG: carbonic anhydrase [Ignavibacteriae bacterium]|nr:carbonic anhydrase [Ignavibacteriota bacterium]
MFRMFALCFALAFGGQHSAQKGVAPDEAMAKLKVGNFRFAANQSAHPNQVEQTRKSVANGQKPFAVIVGCADSRVPPEILFDQGIGDLFVVRVAGNLADDAVIGSIEYAVEHLGSRLVVVLGHERCGAVKATLDGGHPEGHIGALVKAIAPAVEKVRGKGGDELDNAVKLNARLVAEQLRASKPILAEQVAKKKIKIVAARYDLDTGVVEFLE